MKNPNLKNLMLQSLYCKCCDTKRPNLEARTNKKFTLFSLQTVIENPPIFTKFGDFLQTLHFFLNHSHVYSKYIVHIFCTFELLVRIRKWLTEITFQFHILFCGGDLTRTDVKLTDRKCLHCEKRPM